MSDIRLYDPGRDREALIRIWTETSGLDPSDEAACAAVEAFYAAGRTFVAELNGAAECMVFNAMGTLRHGAVDLPFSGVMSVDTGLPARRQGLASRVTAHAVAQDRADGALVSGLGMFDQGFYNKLGFGSGPYEHVIAFNPQHLRVDAVARPPRRLGTSDLPAMHRNCLERRRGHGAVSFAQPGVIRHGWGTGRNATGLGYFDTSGALTHHLALRWKDSEHDGPYTVKWTAWRTGEEFLELMAVLRGLSDQIQSVYMWEPPGIQMQDLLDRPFTVRHVTKGSAFPNTIEAYAFWQMRVNDVIGCLVKTALPWCGGLRFNLVVDDPIGRYLAEGEWRGESGVYRVDLGEHGFAERGADDALPTLTATISAFTRLWLGVLPATSLAMTDALSGPPALLDALDHAFRLPKPAPGWRF